MERPAANVVLLTRAELQAIIDTARRDAEEQLCEGHAADYIPELANIDPKKLGIAVATVNGDMVSCGDAQEPFSIQSISKVFTLTLALGKVGDTLWKRVGREPSGTAFNSIVQLEHEKGVPRNPFINAGAIAVTDVLLCRSPATRGHRPDPGVRQIFSSTMRRS